MPRKGSTPNTNEVNDANLLRLAKTGIGHSEAARELGVAVSAISSLAWSIALVDAGRYTEIPSTSASVRKAKDVEGNRWELIAARTGESVSRVKELYGDDAAVAKASAATPRGRKAGTDGNSSASNKKAATGGKKTAAAASPRRARTRAQRAAARGNNPS